MINNSLFQLQIFNQSKDKLVDQYISRVIKSVHSKNDYATLLFTPNPEQIILSQNDPHFLAALQQADILIPDGIGIVWASQILALFNKAVPIGERISGVDLLKTIVKRFPESSAVVIGGRNTQAEPLAESTLKIEGREIPWLPAYEDVKNPTAAEVKHLETFLKKTKPEILFVAFGAPQQEYWAIRHQQDLRNIGVKLVMVVGGAPDVLSGQLKRAPKIVQSFGLEWLYRLIQEPWRWRRQLRLVQFIQLTLRELFA